MLMTSVRILTQVWEDVLTLWGLAALLGIRETRHSAVCSCAGHTRAENAVKKRAVVFVKGYVSLGLPWGYNYYAASVPHARGEHGFGMCDCNHRSIFPIERITYYQPATDTIMVKLPPLFRHYPTAEKVQPVSAHYHRSCDVMSGQTHQNAPKYIVTQ
eukprot:6970355-Prymnesium_polylepis.1